MRRGTGDTGLGAQVQGNAIRYVATITIQGSIESTEGEVLSPTKCHAPRIATPVPRVPPTVSRNPRIGEDV